MLQRDPESLFIVDDEFAPFRFRRQAETAFADLGHFLFIFFNKRQDGGSYGVGHFEIIEIVAVYDCDAFADVVARHVFFGP